MCVCVLLSRRQLKNNALCKSLHFKLLTGSVIEGCLFLSLTHLNNNITCHSALWSGICKLFYFLSVHCTGHFLQHSAVYFTLVWDHLYLFPGSYFISTEIMHWFFLLFKNSICSVHVLCTVLHLVLSFKGTERKSWTRCDMSVV